MVKMSHAAREGVWRPALIFGSREDENIWYVDVVTKVGLKVQFGG